MMTHAWPGNVRELEYRIMRAVAMAEGSAAIEFSADVTALVKSWTSGAAANNGIKIEVTGGLIAFSMKGFRLEVALE